VVEREPVPRRGARAPGLGPGSWLPRPSLLRRFGVAVLIVLALGGAKVAVGHAVVLRGSCVAAAQTTWAWKP
jgi:hypothetical protein